MTNEQVQLGIVRAKDLRMALNRVAYAMPKDKTQKSWNGMSFEFKETSEKLRITATDGHKLVTLSIGVSGATENKQITIPKQFVLTLQAKVKDCGEDDNVTLLLNGQTLTACLTTTKLTIQLSNAQYPPYKELYRQHKSSSELKQIMVDRKEMLEAAKELLHFYNTRKSDPCTLELKLAEKSIELITRDKGKRKVNAEYLDTKPSLTIGVDIRYLIEFLKSIKSSSVKLELTEACEGIFLRPAKKFPEIEKKLSAIIMPIRL